MQSHSLTLEVVDLEFSEVGFWYIIVCENFCDHAYF